MSIDPLKIIGALTPVGKERLQGKVTGSNLQSFDMILKAAETLPNDEDAMLAKATAVVHMAQLQMLQGLFADEDEVTDNSLFPDIGGAGSLFAPPVSASQNLDNCNDNISLLRQSASTDGSDIDRLIEQVAGKVSLAPELIRSVVNAESNFNPAAESSVGAQGLMQLMPATAKELGVTDSFDPQQNLLGGSQYLKQLLDKYHGDLDHALAAYNWGQGNVDRNGLEKMPQETRDYLVKVKEGLGNASG